MLARVAEFDGDDDKWPGWWFKPQSFLKTNHLGYEVMIERIVQETDAVNLNDAVLSNVDKNHAPDDGETETTAQDAVT